jgi:hypothetical protein
MTARDGSVTRRGRTVFGMSDVSGVFAWNAAAALLPGQSCLSIPLQGVERKAQDDLLFHVRESRSICRTESARGGMFGNRKQKLHKQEQQQAQERFERNEHTGRDIYARTAELKKLDRADLPAAVLMLFREAKHQSELIRQAINERTGHDFESGGMTNGDLATYLAEDATLALRDHVTSPPTFLEALSEQSPEVRFTIQQQDAISMIAAIIREQRIDGVLEGLRLAGLLNAGAKAESRSP